jgi:hypothetical protein
MPPSHDQPSPELQTLLGSLEQACRMVPVPSIAVLIGELERIKCMLWIRMSAPPAPPRVNDPLEELRHLTPAQVGALLNLKPGYVHELCRTRTLPALKTGKYWITPLASVRRWLAYQNRDVDGGAEALLQSLNPEGPAARGSESGGRRTARHR